MGTKSPGGPQRCRIILQGCLAIQLSKPGHTPEDFWMYDSGYMIFQNFLAANAQCWWNAPLTAATRALRYAGHVAPGMLLVTAEPCALEVLRGAYARSVLKPPATYVISSVGDIDDCIVTPTVQGQFTPLPEALCDVIMDLTSQGQSATIENIKTKLGTRFPHMTTPATEVIYDILVQLMQERKIYQTSKGYFIFTPERRRSRSRPRSHRSFHEYEEDDEPHEARTILMTNSEALHSLYGEITTERDGDITHQCIQTNLADVICGGNPNDKILYPRSSKRRSASFPTPRSLERRHSLRFFGSSKRLQRCASTRSLSKTYAQTLATDSSSSEYQSTDSSTQKKGSLLSRLFRRSGRTKQRQIETFSAQFPPAEWFNSRAVHLHSVGTQTVDHDVPIAHTLSNSTFYDGSELSQRSSTLPRRHRRHMSSESTFMISSRDCSPIRRRSPAYCNGSLPRSTQSIPATSSLNQHSTSSSPGPRLQSHGQTKAQKSVIGKHLYDVDEQSNKPKSNSRRINEGNVNDIKIQYRNVQSGPSSIESGKASSMFTSGPSSIDSGKVSYSRTSGHSSLDSQTSSNTTVQQLSSPSKSILILNGSPRSTQRHHYNHQYNHHQYLRSKTPSLETNGSAKSSASSTPTKRPNEETASDSQQQSSGIPNSNSNSSITLQVTTSNSNQNSLPSTKIFVQNSPARSVITLENGKLTENSNVFIINNETMTNENGDIIKKTISKQQVVPTMKNPLKKDTSFCDTNSETCDSISFISEASQDAQDILNSTVDILSNGNGNNRYTKNINNENCTTMNNSRKLSLQLPTYTKGTSNIVYKNVLKNNSNPASPSADINKFCTPITSTVEQNKDFDFAGSVGNLGKYYEKANNDCLPTKMNSNCDLKNLRLESVENLNMQKRLNSNPAINSTDSLTQKLQQKNIVTVGSEPNLALKNREQHKSTLKCSPENIISEKTIEKECFDRRFSLSKENSEEIYNFPSLTDLSFNFTSLAAQKILQGVSLNSIDTLVELNMQQQQQQQKQKQEDNNQQTVCTDYGLF